MSAYQSWDFDGSHGRPTRRLGEESGNSVVVGFQRGLLLAQGRLLLPKVVPFFDPPPIYMSLLDYLDVLVDWFAFFFNLSDVVGGFAQVKAACCSDRAVLSTEWSDFPRKVLHCFGILFSFFLLLVVNIGLID